MHAGSIKLKGSKTAKIICLDLERLARIAVDMESGTCPLSRSLASKNCNARRKCQLRAQLLLESPVLPTNEANKPKWQDLFFVAGGFTLPFKILRSHKSFEFSAEFMTLNQISTFFFGAYRSLH